MPPIKPGEVRNPQGKNGRPPGPPTNFRGRPLGEKPRSVVLWDLQQAAKEASEEGLEILKGCMRDETCDWPTRLRAIELLWERGYGKPQVSVAVNAMHSFAEVPQVMSQDDWLRRRGQPEGDPEGDSWLARQRGLPGSAPSEKRTSDGPSTQGGASSGPPVIDLPSIRTQEAEDPLLTAVDPTEPRPLGSKLN
jgi:hypothetical protein